MHITRSNVDLTTSPFSQRHFGERALIAFIALLSAFIPLSTDLYLPALPSMMEQYQVTEGILNLTLIVFFIFYGMGTLFWGPLSDKYGRRPVLLTGLGIYIVASFLCSCSGGIAELILFRTFQAIGSGAVTAVATAMVKDVFGGRRRIVVLATVQSMMLIAPAVAPVLGAMLLEVTTWQGVFLVLTGIGTVALGGALLLTETLETRFTGTVIGALGRLGVLLKNGRFTTMLALFSLTSVSSMAFVASSSYIYVAGFGLDEQGYSYFFALNAMGLIFAPLAFIFLSRRYDIRPIITASYIVIGAAGLSVIAFGSTGPLAFAIALLPATFCGSLIRAPGTNLMLEQQRRDTGSASSLISCSSVLLGSAGMSFISLGWSDVILVLGSLNAIIGLSCLIIWSAISRKGD